MFSYTECRNRVRLTFICEGAQRTYITDVDYRTAWQTFKGRWMKTTAIEDVDDGGERERLIRRIREKVMMAVTVADTYCHSLYGALLMELSPKISLNFTHLQMICTIRGIICCIMGK